MKMNAIEWGMLIALSLLWGGSFLFVGIAVEDTPPLTIVMGRVTISAILLHIILRVLGHKFPTNASILIAFGVMGLLNNVIPFTLITLGQTHIASGLASILNATTPIFTVIVAHVFTSDEKLNLQKSIGVFLGFTGVAIMIGLDALSAIGSDIWAQFAVLFAALSYAFAGIYGKKFKKMKVAPLTVATGQVTASSFLMLPMVLLFDQPWQQATPQLSSLLALLALAVFSTVFAYILFFNILERAGATNLLLVTFLIPPSAILFGIVILDEVLHPNQILGIVIIMMSLIAIDGRLLKRLVADKSV